MKHGRLVARVWKNRPNTGSYAKKLMAYNGKTQSVREITYDLSKIGDVADYTEVSLEELSALHVDNATTSPDGYVFETAGYHGGWPITEIFGGGYHDRRARLVKGSAVFKLPENNGSLYNYYDTQFLGWVVPPQAEPAHEQ